jgi:hypothetical protein
VDKQAIHFLGVGFLGSAAQGALSLPQRIGQLRAGDRVAVCHAHILIGLRRHVGDRRDCLAQFRARIRRRGLQCGCGSHAALPYIFA